MARDVVALKLAMVLVDQVDLDVAEIGPFAQIVLTDQPVELVDRKHDRTRDQHQDAREQQPAVEVALGARQEEADDGAEYA